MPFVCGPTRPASRFFHQGVRLLPLLLILFFILAGASRTAHAATFYVRSGESLQAALDSARGGDEIVLEAGATYVGPFTLPARADSSGLYVTVRSSALDRLAGGRRVTPEDAPLMPKLVSPGSNQPALLTALGAHHYRLAGLEFAPASESASLRELVRLGDGSEAQDSLDKVAHHLIVDRCYLHAYPDQELVRGLSLNSGATEVINSHVSGFKSKVYDAQAIAGWNGPGPYLIENNYLEGSGENFVLGGADPSIPGLIPTDVVVARNTLRKPPEWRGAWLAKNLLELKAGRRVRITGNVLENSWADGQAGFALMLTVRNQSGGAPWSTISDLEISNNVIRHAGGGVNILGRDDRGAGYESVRMRGVRIAGNLFDDVDAGRWGGLGHFLLVTDAEGVSVEHNTVLNRTGCVVAFGSPGPVGFVFRDNMTGKGEYGVIGGGHRPGTAVLEAMAPGYDFRGNVVAGGEDWLYPAGNFFPGSYADVQFVDAAGGDYRLSAASPYKGRATDGGDPGCDFNALNAAMNPATQPTPSPTPTPAQPTPTPSPTPDATPTPAPTATPVPTPTATPTPTLEPRAQRTLREARRDAQDLSNDLAGTAAPSGPPPNAVVTNPADRIAAVVNAIQQAYLDLSAERALYPAAARAEATLSSSLTYAASANSYAGQNQLAEARAALQKAIDYLEMADVLMVYGNVENPVDYAEFFVRQHYVDFLGREPDESGRAYWTSKIKNCASAQCVERMRIDVSAAYYHSIEFKETGYTVYRLYRGSLGRTVLFNEFLADTQEVGKGIVVGEAGWRERLAANKAAFYDAWVQRADFRARYERLTDAQFVDALYASMGVSPAAGERDTLVASLGAGTPRADVLSRVVENEEFSRLEFNKAFVLMQYFGYLRRDPDQSGFAHWLGKLEEFGGDYRRAEMVKAFLSATEYRDRFRQW